MTTVLNIAAYKFVPVSDPQLLRAGLLARAHALALKGTILLAGEGINLFLAGAPDAVRSFLQTLRADPRFADLGVKESWSGSVPFRRLLVRVKREIIRMNHPAIQPAEGRAPAVDARTLKRWLDVGHDDSGRPVRMLDTRNRFEVEEGHFAGAFTLDIERFSQFPDALVTARAELAPYAVVSYCTGGIRCEKAALFMGEIGMEHHWQLDGGILKYFEEVGGAHFDGLCTVFDERSALDPDLHESNREQIRR